MNNITCNQIIRRLKNFWSNQGCIITQAIDIPVGAGTFHPNTFFNTIKLNPIKIAYLQISRRPTDGRFGKNPNRLQQYYQFQLIIKPVPKNIQELYLKSLKKISINNDNNDIRFVEDNWSNPTLGASGIGWEIWLNGMEITQFTYFQKMGSVTCKPITVEITYGIERIAMHVQKVNNVYDIVWDKNLYNQITYRDLFQKNEIEQSYYNFYHSNIKSLMILFNEYLIESQRLINLTPPLILPAYEQILHAIHNFNLLDARQILSNTERQKYILKIRSISTIIAKKYHMNLKNQFKN